MLIMFLRRCPGVMIRKIGIKSLLLVVTLAIMTSCCYFILYFDDVTTHPYHRDVAGMHLAKDNYHGFDSNINDILDMDGALPGGPHHADHMSARAANNKLRPGHRLPVHVQQEEVVCGAPSLANRYRSGAGGEGDAQVVGRQWRTGGGGGGAREDEEQEHGNQQQCEQHQILVYSHQHHQFTINTQLLGGKKLDRCEYRAIEWESDAGVVYNAPLIVRDEPYYADVQNDFFEVRCFLQQEEKFNEEEQKADYEQLVSRIVEQDDAQEHYDEVLKERERHGTQRHLYDVLIITTEALNHHTLPPVFSDVVLKGYNSLGAELSQSLIPLLTGKSVEDQAQIQKGQLGATYADRLPFIWNQYETSGYVTLFAEDSSTSAVFNQHYNGFEHPPTDHYMRPFWMAVEHAHRDAASSPVCDTSYKHTLQYVEDFFYKYHGIPKIACTVLHATSLEDLSNDLFSMLTRLKTSSILDNTIVLLMSGYNYNMYQQASADEKIDNRMPFVTWNFPEQFREDNPQWMANMWANTERLTTPYDIYQTLFHLIHGDNKKKTTPKRPHGQSLHEIVPANRTCITEGITPAACSCASWEQLDGAGDSGTIRKEVAARVVKYMNDQISEHSGVCATNVLGDIIDAKVVRVIDKTSAGKLHHRRDTIPSPPHDSPLQSPTHHHPTTAYQLVLQVGPGSRVYEATVADPSSSGDVDVVILNKDTHVHPACLMHEHPQIQHYCYCNN